MFAALIWSAIPLERQPQFQLEIDKKIRENNSVEIVVKQFLKFCRFARLWG